MPGIERLIDTWFREVSKHEDVFTLVRIIADYIGRNCGGVDVDNFYFLRRFFATIICLRMRRAYSGRFFPPVFLGNLRSDSRVGNDLTRSGSLLY